MRSLTPALLLSVLLAACSHTPQTVSPETKTVASLERDWIIEKDILVANYHTGVDDSYSFQVYRRHPQSQSRSIYYGLYAAKNNQMSLRAWAIKKSDLEKITNDPAYSFNGLMKNPEAILAMEKQVAAVGKSLGSVANSKKFGKGPIYADGSVLLYGDGAGPRISPIPVSIDEDTRIVAFIESKYEVGSNDTETGRLYMYPTESAQIFAATDKKSSVFKEAQQYSVNTNDIEPVLKKMPAMISETRRVVGADFRSLPHDHRANLSWSK